MPRNQQSASNGDMAPPLPWSRDAEQSVLGAILVDNVAIASASEHLKSEDFFDTRHVFTFSKMVEMRAANIPIDLVTLTEALRQDGELEAAGDVPYLTSLPDGMPRVTNVQHYARIVKEKSLLRSLIHAAHNLTLRAFAAEDTAADIIGEVKKSNLRGRGGAGCGRGGPGCASSSCRACASRRGRGWCGR